MSGLAYSEMQFVVRRRRESAHRSRRAICVVAGNLNEAKKKLDTEYGEGNAFDLHNDDDAAAPRS